ncbi:aldo/keto reductase [Tessaracoccus caeni]|uniref:aldo/keto reductase n=1 Tax=Tessaracoccus caeni TaxID=3031239 RepID=UPI0023DA2924|nr:aldo/keto reductase [Tessaracoccus caeni]MDF1486990.1 aldo/keto reductase [Tessaracoccus caeni]
MVLDQAYTLNNRVTIPKLGLGTWMIDNDQAAGAVRAAAEIGYRHFDTAEGYGNEQGVGEGIRSCGLPRDEVFVTTKLEADYKTYAEAKAGIEGSLRDLDIDYIDLMIIHAPQPWAHFRADDHYFEGNLQAWKALEEAHQAGKIRAIGVSNFEQIDLENLLANGSVKPTVNQILAHISNTPFDVIGFCQDNGILVEAYSPMGHGEILHNPTIVEMAQRYGVTVAQLCIRYCLELGMLPLPKTANPDHMRTNAQVGFTISAEDLEDLKNVTPIENYGDASQFPVYSEQV